MIKKRVSQSDRVNPGYLENGPSVLYALRTNVGSHLNINIRCTYRCLILMYL